MLMILYGTSVSGEKKQCSNWKHGLNAYNRVDTTNGKLPEMLSCGGVKKKVIN